jgi:hypothetical protein
MEDHIRKYKNTHRAHRILRKQPNTSLESKTEPFLDFRLKKYIVIKP